MSYKWIQILLKNLQNFSGDLINKMTSFESADNIYRENAYDVTIAELDINTVKAMSSNKKLPPPSKKGCVMIYMFLFVYNITMDS